MSVLKFTTVAYARDIEVKVPENAYFSLFNSPYPAHRTGTAIDIYFDHEAFLPILEGRVLEIKWFRSPKIRRDSSSIEPLILIEVGEDMVLKVLHVKPSVKPNEKLHLGDTLGKLMVSGYFYPWTTPHAHFELRSRRDPYRARGAYPLVLASTFKLKPKLSTLNMEYRVSEVYESYMWLEARGLGNKPTTGLFARIEDEYGFIDGGIPHYKYGAVLGIKSLEGIVKVNGGTIGKSIEFNENGTIFKPLARFTVDGKPITGIGSYINTKLVKAIGLGKVSLKSGDIVRLGLQNGKENFR